MVRLEQRLARYIIENCPTRTDEALQQRFGISYNTLRKIEAGQMVRRSLAQRLADRLACEFAAIEGTGRYGFDSGGMQ